MTISILQEREDSIGGVNTASISLAFTSAVTAGSSIHVVCGMLDQLSQSFTCVGSLNGSYGAALDVLDDTLGSDGYVMAQFRFDASAAGTETITITPSVSSAFLGVIIREIGGTSGYDGVHPAQIQTGPPGSGTDAVSSGNGTPTVQPGLISAVSNDPTAQNAPNAGTGFTLGVHGWKFGGASNSMTSESKRYTSTAAQAATFTHTSATDSAITLAAFFKEAGGGASTFPPLPGLGPTSQVNNTLLRMKGRIRPRMQLERGVFVPSRKIFLPPHIRT